MIPNQKKLTSIAIIGAGPTGSTLACLLALRGIRCILFDDDKRPSLLVGESLIPAIIPLLQKIGVERQVAEISKLKPGACFRHQNGFRIDIKFNKQGARAPAYAYNIPRPQFDDVLRRRAIELGVSVVSARAKLLALSNDPNQQVLLAEESLAAAGLGEQQPDLIVDASGRNRVLSKLLSLPFARGTRDDVAYFAHYRNFDADTEVDGQIVITVLEQGWSWQIPLKDRLSVGVVLDKSIVSGLGGSAEERLEGIIEKNSLLCSSGKKRERITPVMSYANYPIISERTYGANWVLVGDAMGFTDPMLSPGVFMALKSAEVLDQQLASSGFTDASMQSYSDEINDWYASWTQLIEYFYDGQLLALSEQGEAISSNKAFISLHRFLQWMTKRAVSSMVSGVGTRSTFKKTLFKKACSSVLKNTEFIDQFKVK